MSGISLDHQGLGTPGREHGSTGRLSAEPVYARTGPRRLALLSFAADKDHLALARMTAMHIAGLAGLPIGRVTDIRLAVDEACSLFLTGLVDTKVESTDTAEPTGSIELAEPGGAMITLCFDRLAEYLRISVSGPAPRRIPDADDLGWTMLCALVGRPRWEVRDGIGTLTLTEPVPTATAATAATSAIPTPTPSPSTSAPETPSTPVADGRA